MATILCIDDESDFLQDIVEELQDAGYETVAATNGEEGLIKVRTHEPDLVLCDITMPHMDGYQMLTELRQNYPEYGEMPFIFMSALSDRKEVIVGKARGADDYITKPVDFDLLLVTVASHLRRVKRVRARKDE